MSGSKKVFTTLGSSNHVPEEREAFPEVALFTRRTPADAGSGPDPVGQGSRPDSGLLR